MKKSLKKLSLNKSAVSSLSELIKGGLRRQDDTILPANTTTTDPTELTWCYHC
jgi:hypothetical protein